MNPPSTRADLVEEVFDLLCFFLSLNGSFLICRLPHLHHAPVFREHLKTCSSIAHTVDLELFCLRIMELGIIYNEDYPDLWLRKYLMTDFENC